MITDWRIVVRRHGGLEALEREHFDPGSPGPGEVRVRIEAIGVNYIDVYHRIGLYPLALPSGLGIEAAGVIEAIGAAATGVRVGDRVAWLQASPGAYATAAIVDSTRLIPLPDAISSALAAAALSKGLTAWMLIEQCAKIQAGQTVLIHAAAGGVGSILVPWAKAVGATVIAHTGNPEKAEIARLNGADYAFSGSFETLAGRVRTVTDGRGANVVFDGVGAASWGASLASVAKRGLIISYGNASGPVPPVAPLDLTKAGSVFLTRPTVFDYIGTPEERAAGVVRLFELIDTNKISVLIGQRFALADAAEAHRALETRQTTGSTILIP